MLYLELPALGRVLSRSTSVRRGHSERRAQPDGVDHICRKTSRVGSAETLVSVVEAHVIATPLVLD